MSSSEEQESFDEMFDVMMRVEDSLDDVIDSLRAAGVKVFPEQRGIVARWLDHFAIDTPVPIGIRVKLLREWLESPWLVP